MNTKSVASVSLSLASNMVEELDASELEQVVGGGLSLGATVSEEGGMTVCRDISDGSVLWASF
ncbi:MAG: type A2 lanthipeptide [Polyangiaceae bacterium]